MDKILLKLEAKLNEIDQLKKESAYSAKYQIWNTMTEQLLKQCHLGEELVKIFSDVSVITSSRSITDSNKMYLEHLDEKYEALKNLINAIQENEIIPQCEIHTIESSSRENNDHLDKKRTRKTGISVNLGVFNAKIEEEREI
ncbi:hypothetical protein KKA66_00710 [Patescibacteria group bacterium]|nr:hypothetical protein [Patescibacteria group bacterium]